VAGRDHSFASADVPSHLARGAIGFGSLLVAFALWPIAGWAAVAPAALGVVALRGCPMCWTVGLIQTLSRGRLRRACSEDGCSLVPAGSRVP
jgi:hypothetical protein